MARAPSLAGVVLAGGKSSRFGRDKAQEAWRGRRLIDWSIAALAPYCETIFVAGRHHSSCESVADRPRAGLGPLGGLAGALAAARERGYEHILSLPCDTPHVPPDLLRRLSKRSGAAFVASCPVIGVWPCADADLLAAWLESGQTSAVRAWTQTIGAEPVEVAEPIININRIADLERLETQFPR